MQRRRIRAGTVDPEFYGYDVNPTEKNWEPFRPPKEGVECVWCGEPQAPGSWLAHMIDRHFFERLESWLGERAELKADVRFKQMREFNSDWKVKANGG